MCTLTWYFFPLQYAALQAQTEKLTGELERLRTHLIETEEARELLDAETERKLSDLQQQYVPSFFRSTSLEAVVIGNLCNNIGADVYRLAAAQSKESEGLKQVADFARAANERDDLRKEVEVRQRALANLQAVVEQLQAEQEANTNAEILHLNTQLGELRGKLSAAQAQLVKQQELEAKFVATDRRRVELEAEAEAAKRTEARLSGDLEMTRRALEQSVSKLGAQTRDEENYVDKRLVKKLVLTYDTHTHIFHCTATNPLRQLLGARLAQERRAAADGAHTELHRRREGHSGNGSSGWLALAAVVPWARQCAGAGCSRPAGGRQEGHVRFVDRISTQRGRPHRPSPGPCSRFVLVCVLASMSCVYQCTMYAYCLA
jgi:hypothetical protein